MNELARDFVDRRARPDDAGLGMDDDRGLVHMESVVIDMKYRDSCARKSRL